MPVCCEGFSVIVRNAVVEECLLGGVPAYQELCPNATFCTDGFISRIGFCNLNDARGFISWMAESGLVKEGSTIDFTVVHPSVGFLPRPDWLVFGTYRGIPIAWLTGTEGTHLFIPQVELESKAQLRLVSIEELKRSYQFVGTRGNVEDYVHKVTGQHFYVGRTSGPASALPTQTHGASTDARSLEPRWSQIWRRIREYLRS